MSTFNPEHDWAIVAPWWKWPKPTDTVGGRLTRPVLQKYDSADLVNAFLKSPQHALKFSDEDLVQEVVSKFDVPLGTKNRSRLITATYDQGSGKWFRRVRQPREPRTRKLFLPTHKRFYLVICQLHCDAPGFPKVGREKVCEAGFVVRRRTTPVSPELVSEAGSMLKSIATQRTRLQRIDAAVPGLRYAAVSKRIEGGVAMAEAELQVLDKQRGFVQSLLDAERERLVDWATRFGVAPQLEGWFPTTPKFDNVGEWRAVEETPKDLADEVTYPLYPLIPDPADRAHAGQHGTIYFGLVPAISIEHDPTGTARFDNKTYYEIRCYARRHREPHDVGEACKCPDDLFWSPPTEPYWLASHFDLAGTSHQPVTFQVPDLNDLAAQTTPVAGASIAKQPGSPTVYPDGQKATAGAPTAGFQICSLPIPLITFVAMFLFELFLPIVTFIFGLFWMLALKFCIPPDLTVDAGLTLELDAQLDINMSVSAEASFTLDGGMSLETAAANVLNNNLHDASVATQMMADNTGYSPIAITKWAIEANAATPPNPNAGLEYEVEVEYS